MIWQFWYQWLKWAMKKFMKTRFHFDLILKQYSFSEKHANTYPDFGKLRNKISWLAFNFSKVYAAQVWDICCQISYNGTCAVSSTTTLKVTRLLSEWVWNFLECCCFQCLSCLEYIILHEMVSSVVSFSALELLTICLLMPAYSVPLPLYLIPDFDIETQFHG